MAGTAILIASSDIKPKRSCMPMVLHKQIIKRKVQDIGSSVQLKASFDSPLKISEQHTNRPLPNGGKEVSGRGNGSGENDEELSNVIEAFLLKSIPSINPLHAKGLARKFSSLKAIRDSIKSTDDEAAVSQGLKKVSKILLRLAGNKQNSKVANVALPAKFEKCDISSRGVNGSKVNGVNGVVNGANFVSGDGSSQHGDLGCSNNFAAKAPQHDQLQVQQRPQHQAQPTNHAQQPQLIPCAQQNIQTSHTVLPNPHYHSYAHTLLRNRVGEVPYQEIIRATNEIKEIRSHSNAWTKYSRDCCQTSRGRGHPSHSDAAATSAAQSHQDHHAQHNRDQAPSQSFPNQTTNSSLLDPLPEFEMFEKEEHTFLENESITASQALPTPISDIYFRTRLLDAINFLNSTDTNKMNHRMMEMAQHKVQTTRWHDLLGDAQAKLMAFRQFERENISEKDNLSFSCSNGICSLKRVSKSSY